MSLRIAFDLDGTLADMESALEVIAARLFPERTEGGSAPADDSPAPSGDPFDQITPEEEQLEPQSVRVLTRHQQHAIWEEVHRTENFWESLDETEPGIVARIASIADGRGWEVIFITQRPASAGDTTQRQSQRWLAAHGFPLPSVYVVSGSRGRIAAALTIDLVVDDRPENCLDVKVDSQARAVLVARGDNPSIPPNAKRLGIEVVPSIAALLDQLTGPPEKPSLLERLRGFVGVRS